MSAVISQDAAGVVFALVWPVLLGCLFSVYLQWEAGR
ncbi:hypothetical protein AWB80_03087 [Caballeronia pedi]|uniref:Uncharacterized protein n=1 Tax=Caballeronia pedi TaxID=1777141 RepID=A0A158B785_9BURK|nr:hypothetical protein AWB80_03087 [Caballeronia pedi]